MSSKVIFLDRDGVLNEDFGYVYKAEDLKVLPTVKDSLKKFKEQGYKLIVASNQSGVARGLFTDQDVEQFNDLLNKELDGLIDAFYYCPYHPDAIDPSYRIDSDYRKPGVGMLEQAFAEHPLTKTGSYFIGDKSSDVDTAISFGIDYFQMNSRYDAHDQVSKRYETLAEIVPLILV